MTGRSSVPFSAVESRPLFGFLTLAMRQRCNEWRGCLKFGGKKFGQMHYTPVQAHLTTALAMQQNRNISLQDFYHVKCSKGTNGADAIEIRCPICKSTAKSGLIVSAIV